MFLTLVSLSLCVCVQGMAFSLEERLQLGIHGLLPPCFLSQDVQLLRVLRNFDRKKDDLDRSGKRTRACKHGSVHTLYTYRKRGIPTHITVCLWESPAPGY